jgi:hypothetical protein
MATRYPESHHQTMDRLHGATWYPGQQRQPAAPRTRPLPTATTTHPSTPAPHTKHPHAPGACLSRVRGQPARTVLRRRWTQQCAHRYPTTTDGSSPDSGQCAASKRSARPTSSVPATHSSKTSAAATTNSAWNSTHGIGSQRPSPNSPSPSDRGATPRSRTASRQRNNAAE